MENACNYTSAATSFSIVLGGCLSVWVPHRYLIGLQERKGLHLPVRRPRGHRQLDTIRSFRV